MPIAKSSFSSCLIICTNKQTCYTVYKWTNIVLKDRSWSYHIQCKIYTINNDNTGYIQPARASTLQRASTSHSFHQRKRYQSPSSCRTCTKHRNIISHTHKQFHGILCLAPVNLWQIPHPRHIKQNKGNSNGSTWWAHGADNKNNGTHVLRAAPRSKHQP